MLPARVYAPLPPKPAQEDIFASSISILFTDDVQNSHGLPGQSVIYTSPKFGDIKLGIPAHPDLDEGRRLFAHYLWNAGVVAADAIETASSRDQFNITNITSNAVVADEDNDKVKWDRKYWDVKDKDVLELGAGTALPSLISALSGAHSITITDHPSSPALVTDTIARNVLETLKIDLLPPPPPSPQPHPSDTKAVANDAIDTSASATHSNKDTHTLSTQPGSPATHPQVSNALPTCSQVSIHGLSWGTPAFTSSTAYGKLSDQQPEPASFDKIIVADCLWMPSQHANIVKTLNTYLRLPSDADNAVSIPCALVVAGFHTGRNIVARFFEIATGSRTGRCEGMIQGEEGDRRGDSDEDKEDEDEDEREVKGTLYAAEMIEVDVDRNVRAWLPERPGESREQAKRWCVCAALVRR